MFRVLMGQACTAAGFSLKDQRRADQTEPFTCRPADKIACPTHVAGENGCPHKGLLGISRERRGEVHVDLRDHSDGIAVE